MESFIITFTPYFKKSAIRDINKIDTNAKLEKLITDGQALISSEFEKDVFLDKLKRQGSAFIKHICPAIFVGQLSGNLEIDKQEVLNSVLLLNPNIFNGSKFAVQTRIVGGSNADNPLSYNSKDIEVFVGSYFDKKGAIPTFSDKKITNEDKVKIISVFINKNDLYIGISDASQNLNFHCDDYRISSKDGGREISRAENKLKEALAKYNLHLEGEGKIALDIGAAPGGWTKVLVDHGYLVIAVDPGELHPNLRNHPKIKHYKCRIEDLKFENYFDIIVNDMNVDPTVTGQIMTGLAGSLKDNGLAIVTIKLPDNPERGVEEGKKSLSVEYNILSTNSLFHNRQEVTTLIQKKEIKRELPQEL